MCSVLQRPIPVAPNCLALAASSGLSAFVNTPRYLISSAHSSAFMSSSSFSNAVSIVGTCPRYTSPVFPSMLIQSPSSITYSFTVNRFLLVSIRISSQPATQGFPHPLATTAAWLVPPPCCVRKPSDTTMPFTSSGVVSGRTRITGSPAFPLFSALSALNIAIPTAAPGLAFNPFASNSASFLASGSNCGWRS